MIVIGEIIARIVWNVQAPLPQGVLIERFGRRLAFHGPQDEGFVRKPVRFRRYRLTLT